MKPLLMRRIINRLVCVCLSSMLCFFGVPESVFVYMYVHSRERRERASVYVNASASACALRLRASAVKKSAPRNYVFEINNF